MNRVPNKASSHESATLFVANMDCNNEVVLIDQALKHLPGVQRWQANIMTREVVVEYDAAKVTLDQVVQTASATGLQVTAKSQRPTVTAKRRWLTPQMIALVVSSVLVLSGFAAEMFGVPHRAVQVLFGGAIIIGAYFPARMGVLALRTLTLNIRLLMVVGAAGAVALGLWEESALLVVIYSFGDVLEAYAVDRARGAVKALMELAPKEALVRRNGTEVVLPIDQVRIGDIVVIRPGEKIPIDGRVTVGASYVDTSTITGEPMPVHTVVGNEVFAGTINQKGSLEIEVTKLARDTTLARIIHSVEEAQAKKSSYQRFAEKFGRIYTPAMFALALLVAVAPPVLFAANWAEYIYRGLVVLVVSCSCGLALSVPVSVVAAIATAARRGVLFKGGVYLEAAAKLKAFAFDKTGTLTIGLPVVTDVVPFNGLSQNDVLSVTASIESRSEHPLAEAIVRHTRSVSVAVASAPKEFDSVTGQGVRARVNGKSYLVGNQSLLDAHGVKISPARLEVIAGLEQDAKTIVLLADEQQLLGVVAVADQLRPHVQSTLASLKNEGLRTIMLTGDHLGTASAIAAQAGVDEFYAGLLPEQKVETIERIREKFGAVGMVGDGINDAPALAAADVGIAMGTRGTDIAKETGDVVLMSDDLAKLPLVLHLSRRAVSNMRQNTIASLVIVAVLIPAALAGWIGLVPGLLFNEVSALLVIANALRLLRY